ncbi:MAG TPA: AAA family ATPase [Solirubrobacteraceae bacterium]|nr:AAA family ATPase [Solirubrobacteraceae bacterium]
MNSGPDLEKTLLERESELEVLDDLVMRAAGGAPAVAVIEGPAGIGKTRLLLAARERARRAGLREMAARGSDLERGLPYGVVRQLFEPALSEPAARDRWLTGAAADAAPVFDPRLLDDPADDTGFAARYALSWLTANVAAEGGLLLAIDDLQWSDVASLRFLTYLLRRTEGLGVMIVVAIRTGEPNVETRLLDEFAGDPLSTVVSPRGLSDDAVATLVRERLGAQPDRAFVSACQRATGGNAFLLGEVLKAMSLEGVAPKAADVDAIRDVGPRAISRSVLLRLVRLGQDAVAVAQAVAVLGDGAALPATARLSGLSEERVATASRTLSAAEILGAETPFAFVHPLVHDAVYLELAPAERELRHERAATVLRELAAPLERVAAHLRLVPARADARVAEVLEQVGLDALRRADPDTAAAHLRRALAEPPAPERRPGVLINLGLAEALVNDRPAAIEHLRAGFEGSCDPGRRAAAAEVLVRILLYSGSAAEAAVLARRAAESLPSEMTDESWRLEALELVSIRWGATIDDAAPRLQAARSGLRSEGVGARMIAGVAASEWAMTGGSMAECLALARAALAGGALTATNAPMAGTAIFVLDLANEPVEAMVHWDAARAAAHRHSSESALGALDLVIALSRLYQGELQEAEALMRPSDPGRRAAIQGPYGQSILALVLVERGDLAAARRVVEGRLPTAPGTDADALGLQAESGLLLAERRWPEALEATARYAASVRTGVVNPAWVPWRSQQAQALIGLERHGEARALLEDELVFARQWGAPGAVSRTVRLLAACGPEPDLELAAQAVDVSKDSGAHLEHAKALITLGGALRRTGERTRAREPLRAGLQLALRCGADRLAEHARTELYAVGGRPRRDALSGPASLTPSEHRIAELVVDGLSNREVAQALFVTPRTVEYHLTSVYRKLGISARAAIAETLGRMSPP